MPWIDLQGDAGCFDSEHVHSPQEIQEREGVSILHYLGKEETGSVRVHCGLVSYRYVGDRGDSS